MALIADAGSRYQELAVVMVIAYKGENSAMSEALPSTTLACLYLPPCLKSPDHHPVLILVLIFNLLSLRPISCRLRQQPHFDPCTTSPLPSALQHFLRGLLSQILGTKQQLSNIYRANCSKPGLLGNCTGKSKQCKYQSYDILIMLQG